MGYLETEINLPPGYGEDSLKERVGKKLKIRNFTYKILGKSLDARDKKNILWKIRAAVISNELPGKIPDPEEELVIRNSKRNQKALVTGSGPAGFFAAYILQLSGFQTTILERGTEVDKRQRGIRRFEQTGIFDPGSNYAFGEGGAGTFSDGKLTSRSKHISKEKKFILQSYIRAGAPEEIAYLAYPHVGSDYLRKIVKNLRNDFLNLGGVVLFETMLEDLQVKNSRVLSAVTTAGIIDSDIFIVAPGHSSYETYRMLDRRGVGFRTKNFALGFRAEHLQEVINRAQWGCPSLPGVKAAEYRLASNREGRLPVFTFCMCPGGMVVPATPYETSNIVNGMSMYNRDGIYANAACVAGIHPDCLTGNSCSAMEAIDGLKQLEERFYSYSNGYQAPFCTITGFLNKEVTEKEYASSYPLGLVPAPLWNMVPQHVADSIAEGLQDFNRRLRGYKTGILLGLESKTSSPIQVLRDQSGKCTGFENLYMAGEGSGYSGGIISSGADGIRIGMAIASQI